MREISFNCETSWDERPDICENREIRGTGVKFAREPHDSSSREDILSMCLAILFAAGISWKITNWNSSFCQFELPPYSGIFETRANETFAILVCANLGIAGRMGWPPWHATYKNGINRCPKGSFSKNFSSRARAVKKTVAGDRESSERERNFQGEAKKAPSPAKRGTRFITVIIRTFASRKVRSLTGCGVCIAASFVRKSYETSGTTE